MAGSERKRTTGNRGGRKPAESVNTQTGSANGVPAKAGRDQIASRAYEIYLSRGAAHGGDFDDWLQAEREIARR